MTVKELKEFLDTVDENLPVIVSYAVNDEYGGAVSIKKEDVEVAEMGNWITDGRDENGQFIQHYERYPALCIGFES